MKNFFLLTFIFLSSACYAETKEELNKEADAKLDSSVEQFQLGGIEIFYGVYQIAQGNPVGGAVAIGLAAKTLKSSFNDFVEARDLYEQARNAENNDREFDRDSWDHDRD